MTIEVRQMLIKSTVGAESAPAPTKGGPCASDEKLREEVVSELKVWMEEKLRQVRER